MSHILEIPAVESHFLDSSLPQEPISLQKPWKETAGLELASVGEEQVSAAGGVWWRALARTPH